MKFWPQIKPYLLSFGGIFFLSLLINMLAPDETICITETWCPKRGEEALLLAVLFTLPFLALLAFLKHIFPSIAQWIFDHPQHGLSIVFFFMGVVPVVPLTVFPEELSDLKKTLCYAAIGVNVLFGFLTIAFASTFPKEERWAKGKRKSPAGVLLLIGLFFCIFLTVAAVSNE